MSTPTTNGPCPSWVRTAQEGETWQKPESMNSPRSSECRARMCSRRSKTWGSSSSRLPRQSRRPSCAGSTSCRARRGEPPPRPRPPSAAKKAAKVPRRAGDRRAADVRGRPSALDAVSGRNGDVAVGVRGPTRPTPLRSRRRPTGSPPVAHRRPPTREPAGRRPRRAPRQLAAAAPRPRLNRGQLCRAPAQARRARVPATTRSRRPRACSGPVVPTRARCRPVRRQHAATPSAPVATAVRRAPAACPALRGPTRR